MPSNKGLLDTPPPAKSGAPAVRRRRAAAPCRGGGARGGRSGVERGTAPGTPPLSPRLSPPRGEGCQEAAVGSGESDPPIEENGRVSETSAGRPAPPAPSASLPGCTCCGQSGPGTERALRACWGVGRRRGAEGILAIVPRGDVPGSGGGCPIGTREHGFFCYRNESGREKMAKRGEFPGSAPHFVKPGPRGSRTALALSSKAPNHQ